MTSAWHRTVLTTDSSLHFPCNFIVSVEVWVGKPLEHGRDKWANWGARVNILLTFTVSLLKLYCILLQSARTYCIFTLRRSQLWSYLSQSFILRPAFSKKALQSCAWENTCKAENVESSQIITPGETPFYQKEVDIYLRVQCDRCITFFQFRVSELSFCFN